MPIEPIGETNEAAARSDRRNLLFTVAFDPHGSSGMRQMAKMLGSSVVRTGFNGDMVIFHNSREPVFVVGRRGIEEVRVEMPEMDPATVIDFARGWKVEAVEILDVEECDWVMFADAGCLCLRNIDHLLAERDCDILYQRVTGRSMSGKEFNGYLTAGEFEKCEELAARRQRAVEDHLASRAEVRSESPLPPEHYPLSASHTGITFGVWAVRGQYLDAVMKEWSRIYGTTPARETERRDQSAWNRLILDAGQHGWRAQPFEAHEVQFPLGADTDWKLYKDAAIVHCAGGTIDEKVAFMLGLYVQRFLHDPGGTLLNILEP